MMVNFLLLSVFTGVFCCLTSKPDVLSLPKRRSKGFYLKPESHPDRTFFFAVERRKTVVQIPPFSVTPHLLKLLCRKDDLEQISHTNV